jgi:hypothetical protein
VLAAAKPRGIGTLGADIVGAKTCTTRFAPAANFTAMSSASNSTPAEQYTE